MKNRHVPFYRFESPPGHVAEDKCSPHEMFLYVIRGAMDADVGGKKRRVAPGDVVHVPRGAAYRWRVGKKESARYAADNWRG